MTTVREAKNGSGVNPVLLTGHSEKEVPISVNTCKGLTLDRSREIVCYTPKASALASSPNYHPVFCKPFPVSSVFATQNRFQMPKVQRRRS